MNEKYVLLTIQNTYFVEYLIGELVLSHSISEAMVFTSWIQATRFKEMLYEKCAINCSINTFIDS